MEAPFLDLRQREMQTASWLALYVLDNLALMLNLQTVTLGLSRRYTQFIWDCFKITNVFLKKSVAGFCQGVAICMSCQKQKEKVRLCDVCLLPALALSLIQSGKIHPGQSRIKAGPALPKVIKTKFNKNLAWLRELIPDISGINPDCIALEINSSLIVPWQ